MGSAGRIQNIGDTPAYRGNVARALATAVHLGHRHVFEDASGVESGLCIVHPMLVLRREMPVDERQFFLAHHGSSVSRVSGTLDARLSRESASVIRRHRRRSPDGSCPPSAADRGRSHAHYLRGAASPPASSEEVAFAPRRGTPGGARRRQAASPRLSWRARWPFPPSRCCTGLGL